MSGEQRPKKPSYAATAPIPDQVAVRYRVRQGKKVHERLAPFGDIEDHPSERMLILHRKRSVSRRKLEAAIGALRDEKLVEFATPVLRHRESGLRQVLTDEIVVRLKPTRAAQRVLAALKGEHGLESWRRNEFEPSQYIVKVSEPSGTHTLDVARSLDERSDVEFAAPNFITDVKR